MSAPTFDRSSVPSMPESEARDSLAEWRRLESRRQWVWIAVCGLVGGLVLAAILLRLNGGVFA